MVKQPRKRKSNAQDAQDNKTSDKARKQPRSDPEGRACLQSFPVASDRKAFWMREKCCNRFDTEVEALKCKCVDSA